MKSILFFLLLISSSVVFGQNSVMDFYNAKVKDMAKADGGSFKLKLTKQDAKNGFLAYNYSPALGYMIGVLDSPEEMAYFVAKNGKKFVVTSTLSKQNFDGSVSWSGELPKFYELEKGVLVDKSSFYFPTSSQILEELSLEGKSIYTKVPQIGTTIQIGTIDRKVGVSSFKVVYQLVFDTNSGSFKVVKI
ncbi:MAG: hypothetical protein MUC49_08990 [Raineya sp.]|jgi:hypothetical protein|nr:hypothetical protein [Raineya sp.]